MPLSDEDLQAWVKYFEILIEIETSIKKRRKTVSSKAAELITRQVGLKILI
jgi:hypothetical protein